MIGRVATVLVAILEHGGTRSVITPTLINAIVMVQAVGGPFAGLLLVMEHGMP